MSVRATDREIGHWYTKIQHGEVKLPRFQRHQAWDTWRIESLMTTIIHDLPLGITLVLEVDEEQFISRYIATAEPSEPQKVHEHLLDGQQRLTAIWRVLQNNYENEKYFLYLEEYDEVWEDEDEDVIEIKVIRQNRWLSKKSNKLMPLWADIPSEMFKRGCIPMDLLKPEDIGDELDKWLNQALDFVENIKRNIIDPMDLIKRKEKLKEQINSYRETIRHYNLPFLGLPSSTTKDTALEVFINMNTNSKPLSQYDIIVAEIEGLKGVSLHNLQQKLMDTNPSISKYFDLSFLILYTSALMQGKIPSKKGIWDMDKNKLVENWDQMEKGLTLMTEFLRSHNIFDENRLPTNAVLAVIAALYTKFPESGDQAGQLNQILKKYLWSSFFTDRYENSAASRAYVDFSNILSFLNKDTKPETGSLYTLEDAPVFDRSLFPLCTEDELLNVKWPKRVNIRARGVLAVANYFGSLDFADGSPISDSNVKSREYHHIFPDALIKEANRFLEEKLESFLALNCSLITGATNRNIGRKDPYDYLKERYSWVNEEVVLQRLHSHLIPVDELKAGSYDIHDNNEKAIKIKDDYYSFLRKRASIMYRAVIKLVEGNEVHVGELID